MGGNALLMMFYAATDDIRTSQSSIVKSISYLSYSRAVTQYEFNHSAASVQLYTRRQSLSTLRVSRLSRS